MNVFPRGWHEGMTVFLCTTANVDLTLWLRYHSLEKTKATIFYISKTIALISLSLCWYRCVCWRESFNIPSVQGKVFTWWLWQSVACSAAITLQHVMDKMLTWIRCQTKGQGSSKSMVITLCGLQIYTTLNCNRPSSCREIMLSRDFN